MLISNCMVSKALTTIVNFQVHNKFATLDKFAYFIRKLTKYYIIAGFQDL